MSLQEAIPGATMKKTACGNTIRDTKTAKKNRLLKTAGRVIVLITAVVLILIVGFGLYTSQYYRADADAIEVLQRGSDRVTITSTDYGWFFDGPSEDSALIFYPGAKVEETAYAPLLHRIAEGQMDVCLVKMPFHLAVFDRDAAEKVIPQYEIMRNGILAVILSEAQWPLSMHRIAEISIKGSFSLRPILPNRFRRT